MGLSMNSKTKYMIPAFAAVFALMFTFATPYVMAEPGDRDAWKDGAKWSDEKYSKKGHHGHKAILVEGFVGTIPIPEEKNEETHELLKSQVTVSLGQAVDVAESNGFTDAMKASIGIAKDGEGNKYVVWTIASMDKDSESETMTANIFVVDAGDAANFTQVTKTFDHSKMEGKMHSNYGADGAKFSDPERLENKIQKIEQKINEGAGDSESDQRKVEFIYLLRQLQTAITNGDDAQADSLREQLKELRNQMIDLKKFK